jgi:peptidoglycan/LPS O-acetylase OafA/YrhL
MTAVLPSDPLAAAPAARQHLRPLTSLRFIAAAMVVLLHSRVMFPVSDRWGESLSLSEGVTFFFILSGFILTYAYPRLDEAGTRRFLVARLARLWPIHAATLVLMLIPLAAGMWGRPPDHVVPAALAALAMVHGWVPYPDSYFAFNSPSWSISTEVAFYLLFPLLIHNWRRTWHVKLMIGLVFTVALTRLSTDVLALPTAAPDQPGADLPGLLSISPLATVYQFMLGMTAAMIWQPIMRKARLGVAMATLLELGAIGAVVWCLTTIPSLPMLLVPLGAWLGWAWLAWVPPVPLSVLAFATLIVVGALGQGLVSRLLACGPFVLLGEISYSVYLIHLPVIFAYNIVGRPLFGRLPDPVEYAIFWLAVLGSAWLLWWSVERPARAAIRGWYARYEGALSDGQWRIVGVGIAALVVAILTIRVATLR